MRQITDAKLQTKSEIQKFMDKKNTITPQKDYESFCLAVCLANKCYHRDNKGEKTADGCYDGTIKQDTLRAVLAAETTTVYERATLIGYLKVCAAIFKETFLKKKVNRSYPILRGAFSTE